MEEVQSDWHQKGRKEGYKGEQDREFVDLIREWDALPFGPERNIIQRRLDVLGRSDPGVPDAPFKKTWHELALRRMLRYASENGYDVVSWTGGAKQAARYDLSKQIGELAYWKTKNGRIGMNSVSPEGRVLDGMEQELEPSQLEDFVGKDVAKKIIETLVKVILSISQRGWSEIPARR